MRSILTLAATLAIVGSMVIAGGALATPGSAIMGDPVIGGRAAFTDEVSIDVTVTAQDGEAETASVTSGDVMVQRVLVGPSGTTGWHSHPGPAIVTIVAGTLTLFDADDPTCTGQDYAAGEAFVDLGAGHVHIGRNLSETDGVQLFVTYLGVPAGESPRTDEEDPGTC
jgi:quercetin dioxygenase-like cupin family protein